MFVDISFGPNIWGRPDRHLPHPALEAPNGYPDRSTSCG